MKRVLFGIVLGLMLGCAIAPLSWANGPWRAVEKNTEGWQFMTPDERIEHQRRMRSFETYEDCKVYQDDIHARMVQRALLEGVVLQPKSDGGCEQMRQRGQFK